MAVKTKSIEGNYGWVITIITLLCGFTAAANMAKVIVLAPVISQVFGLNEGVLGLVIASFYILGLIMAFPATPFINKLGLRSAVLMGVLFGALGCVLGGISTGNLPLFIVSRIFEGMGFGIMGVAGSSAIAPWFKPEKRSIPLSLWSIWVPVMMCICPVLYGWMVDSMGLSWQAVWWGNLAFDIAVALLFWLLYREPLDARKPEEGENAGPKEKARFSRAFKSKGLWALAIIFFFDEAAFMAINGFLTTYLTSEVGVTLIVATTIYSTFGLATAVFPPIGAWIAQRWNSHRWVFLVALCCGVFYTATVFALKDPNLYFGLAIIDGIVGGWVPSIIWQFAPNTVEKADIPAANSLMSFSQNTGMLIGTICMGNLVMAFGWTMGSWIALVPCYIIALIVFFVFRLHKNMKLDVDAKA